MYVFKHSFTANADLESLPKSPRGAPLMLGQLDERVQKWVRGIRSAGGTINVATVRSGATAIVLKYARHRHVTHGGSIDVTKDVARSLLRRMGFVKRRGTKGVKTLKEDFDTIKAEFNERVAAVKAEHNVSDELIINWDQTSVHMVPGGEWTMEQRGASQDHGPG